MVAVTSRVLPKQAEQAQQDLRRIGRAVERRDRLHLGDKGGAVEALQRALRRAGLYSGKIDGNFDQQTKRAVQAFQRAQGLNPSGAVGPKTEAALNDSTLFLNDAFEAPAKRGHAGSDVLMAERRLTALGYRSGKVDGVFDKKTAQAVRAFRADNPELDDNWGALNKRVWDNLQQAYQQGVQRGIDPNERIDGLRKTERKLDRLGYNVGKVDGRFNAATAAAVAQFQRQHDLDVTGRVNAKTAKAIEKASVGIDTVKEANKHFLTQWGPTKYNKAGSGKYGYADCAPTSAVMAASALGIMQHPSPAKASKAIDHMRDLQRGHNTNYSSSTSHTQLKNGLRKAGAQVKDIKGFDAINQALKKGHTLVMGGNPWNAWGKRLRSQGKYLNSKDPGPHSIAVLGRTADGRYLVADPLSKAGTIAVRRETLAKFLAHAPGTVLEVSKRK